MAMEQFKRIYYYPCGKSKAEIPQQDHTLSYRRLLFVPRRLRRISRLDESGTSRAGGPTQEKPVIQTQVTQTEPKKQFGQI
jgi:hypothetical protein